MTNEDSPGGGGGAHRRSRLHDALSSATRRHVLHYFRVREDRTASVGELAAALADADGGVDDPALAELRLHHCSLPLLDEIGVIDYDSEAGAVRYRGEADLESLLSEGPATLE